MLSKTFDGRYVNILGNNSTAINTLDLGWNLSGTYISEPLNSSNLGTNAALYWKNTGGGQINVKVRAGNSSTSLGLADWSDTEKNGSLSP
jgi:hypothetical protein